MRMPQNKSNDLRLDLLGADVVTDADAVVSVASTTDCNGRVAAKGIKLGSGTLQGRSELIHGCAQATYALAKALSAMLCGPIASLDQSLRERQSNSPLEAACTAPRFAAPFGA